MDYLDYLFICSNKIPIANGSNYLRSTFEKTENNDSN